MLLPKHNQTTTLIAPSNKPEVVATIATTTPNPGDRPIAAESLVGRTVAEPGLELAAPLACWTELGI